MGQSHVAHIARQCYDTGLSRQVISLKECLSVCLSVCLCILYYGKTNIFIYNVLFFCEI